MSPTVFNIHIDKMDTETEEEIGGEGVMRVKILVADDVILQVIEQERSQRLLDMPP